MMYNNLKFVSKYKLTGALPEAIEKLVLGLRNGVKKQMLHGIMRFDKTFTMANIIAKVNSLLLFCKRFVSDCVIEFKVRKKLELEGDSANDG